MRVVIVAALCGCAYNPTRVETPAPDAFVPTFTFSKTITIHPTNVATDLVGFPMLFELPGDADLASRATADGSDIVFVDANGERVPHELEVFAKGSGAIRAWIRVPRLTAATSTTLSMGYGAAQPPSIPADVWDASFEGVYHFADVGVIHDSTARGRDGTPVNGPIASVGAIGGAIGFTTGGAHVALGDNFNFVGAWTVSFWTRATIASPPSNSFARIVARIDYTSGAGFTIQQRATNGHAQIGRTVANTTQFGSDTNPIPTTSFALIHAVYDGATVSLYRDGVAGLSNPDVRPMPAVSKALTVGCDLYSGGPGDTYLGDVDELRIASVVRSADWIVVETANQQSPSAFYDVGPETAR